MATYNITKDGDVLRVSFGDAAQNDRIVLDAAARVQEMIAAGELTGGKVIKINGPASLPVACVLAHALGHLYGAVGVFDPKLGKYVVAISHDADSQVGSLID